MSISERLSYAPCIGWATRVQAFILLFDLARRVEVKKEKNLMIGWTYQRSLPGGRELNHLLSPKGCCTDGRSAQ